MAPSNQASWIREKGGVVFVRVHAQPGSSRSEVAEVDAWRGALSIRLVSRAQQGEANGELIEVLAAALRVPPSAVTLDKGGKSRDKTVRIDGLSLDIARQRLGGAP